MWFLWVYPITPRFDIRYAFTPSGAIAKNSSTLVSESDEAQVISTGLSDVENRYRR
jgi:hypothetical protein